MNVQTLMKLFAVGELSNLSPAETGEISEEYKPTLLTFIQETLDKFYGRFYLKTDSIYVDLIDGKTEYELTSKHLMDSSLVPDYDHYLFKPGNREFKDDILRILRVIDSSGRQLPINSPEDIHSVFTPFFNVLQVPFHDPRKELEVIYASKHAELSLESELELPDALIPALRAYVAYMVHANMNIENAVNNAQKYLSQYNAIINELISSDIINNPNEDSNIKFVARGWI